MSSRGNLLVISGPSGSGKTTLAVRVLKEVTNICFSVSYTTRPPRRGEQEGRDYFFVTEQEFGRMIEQDAFLEYATVYGNLYGTAREFVEARRSEGDDVLLDIDVQGGLLVKSRIPEAIMVFVLPPSFDLLAQRLQSRGLDDSAVIKRRLEIACQELTCLADYEYVIINEDVEDSVAELKWIVLASRSRLGRRREQTEKIQETFLKATTEEKHDP